MTPKWLETMLGSGERTSSAVWFGSFCCVLLVLAAIEVLVPAFKDPPRRDRRWPANLGLAAINMALEAAVPISAVLAAAWAQSNDFGLINRLLAPGWPAAAATLLLYSACGYVVHVLMHKVPLLWRVHRVHHLDIHIDVSTSLRSHPLELFITLILMAPAAALFGLTPWIIALYELCEVVFSAVSHANLRLPKRLDHVLRYVLVTPNMHSIHHSARQPETDSNYGAVLSLWDRLFRTYTDAPVGGYEKMTIGLHEVRDERAFDLLWQLVSPALPRLQAGAAVGAAGKDDVDKVRRAT